MVTKYEVIKSSIIGFLINSYKCISPVKVPPPLPFENVQPFCLHISYDAQIGFEYQIQHVSDTKWSHL